MADAVAPEEVNRIIEKAERQFNDCVLRRDIDCAKHGLSDDFFLLVNIEGRPFLRVPAEEWLNSLQVYYLEAIAIDEIAVSVYGDTAVAALRYFQKGHTAGERDISGNFLLTDVWINTPQGWRLAERHSSRAEKLPNAS